MNQHEFYHWGGKIPRLLTTYAKVVVPKTFSRSLPLPCRCHRPHFQKSCWKETGITYLWIIVILAALAREDAETRLLSLLAAVSHA